MANHVAERAVDLGGATDRIRVLNDVVALAVKRKQLAARQKPHQIPSRGQLTRMRAEPHDSGVECTVGSEDGLDRERSRDVRDLGEPARAPSRQHPMAVMPCVPLTRARPSLASSTSGSRPHRRRASMAGSSSPARRTSPSPMTGRARCASGARSPEAPSDPCSGTTGRRSLSSISTNRSTTSRRTPSSRARERALGAPAWRGPPRQGARSRPPLHVIEGARAGEPWSARA